MSKKARIIIVVALALAVAGALLLKPDRENTLNASAAKTPSIPTLIDLGADKCIPCKMMAPILEELKKEYEGRLEVTFIDVWKDPAAGENYNIRVIPTQIFLDPAGRELFRHEGFFAKEDILSQWNQLGYKL